MATRYDVRQAFQSRGLNEWICRDTERLVAKLPKTELDHAIKTGMIVEVEGIPAVQADGEAAGTKSTDKGGK